MDPDRQTPRQGPPQPELSDEQLVEACRRELPYNTTSFEILLHRHEAQVYRTCRHYLGSAEDAEEVSQDIFLRIFHGLEKFEGAASVRT